LKGIKIETKTEIERINKSQQNNKRNKKI